jgi:hypothetical protein
MESTQCCKVDIVYMPTIIQRDATIYSLFISVNRSTCFGWYLHPSSGAHGTVATASGISKTVTANCRERDWTGTDFYWVALSLSLSGPG